MATHLWRQFSHSLAVEAVGDEVEHIAVPNLVKWHAMEPTRQEVIDAKDAAQLQHPVFHHSLEGWVNGRILNHTPACVTVPARIRRRNISSW